MPLFQIWQFFILKGIFFGTTVKNNFSTVHLLSRIFCTVAFAVCFLFFIRLEICVLQSRVVFEQWSFKAESNFSKFNKFQNDEFITWFRQMPKFLNFGFHKIWNNLLILNQTYLTQLLTKVFSNKKAETNTKRKKKNHLNLCEKPDCS